MVILLLKFIFGLIIRKFGLVLSEIKMEWSRSSFRWSLLKNSFKKVKILYMAELRPPWEKPQWNLIDFILILNLL